MQINKLAVDRYHVDITYEKHSIPISTTLTFILLTMFLIIFCGLKDTYKHIHLPYYHANKIQASVHVTAGPNVIV